MNRFLKTSVFLAFGLLSLAIVTTGYAATLLFAGGGGTGTSTPSGILWGDNGLTGSLKTLTIGSNLTLTGSTLSASGGGSSAFPFTPLAWGNSTSTTLGFLNGFVSTASSTIDSDFFINGVAGHATTTIDAGVKITPSASVSSSVSAGGIFNLTNTLNDGAGAVFFTNHGTGALGRLVVIDCNSASFDQSCLHIQGQGTQSIVNIQGGANGLGTIKVANLSGAASNNSSSLISLDTSVNAFNGQGLFIKHNSATTTAALNILDSGSNTIFKVDGVGLTTMKYSSTSILANFAIASTTSLYVSSVPNAIPLMGVDGLMGKYGGSNPCSNQVALSISALGVIGCTSVSNAMLSNSNVTITAGTNLSGGGSVSLGGTIVLVGTGPVATSSQETAGQLAAWGTTNGQPAKLYSVATSTPSAGTAITWSGTGSVIGSLTANFTAPATSALTIPFASTTALTSVTASTTNLYVSGAANGSVQCAQLGTDGKVTGTGSACGSGGATFAYPFTPNATGVFWNQISVSTTTQVHFGATGVSLSASSTSQFDYASSTALTAGNLFATNLTLTNPLTTANGGTGRPNPGGTSAGALLEFDGTNGTSVISAGAQYTTVQSTAAGSGFTTDAVHLDQSGAVTGNLPLNRGGTAASSFTNSGNAVYYSGSDLRTAPLTSAIVTPYASSTIYGSFINASSTFYLGAGLDAGCTGSNFAQFSGGRFTCGTPAGAGASPFAWLTNFATNTAATTTSIASQGVFFSSSTVAASQFPLASSTQLSATTFYLGGSSGGTPGMRTLTSANTGFYGNSTAIGFTSNGTDILLMNASGISNTQEYISSWATNDPTNPAYTWSGGNMGLYKEGTNILGLSTAGVERLRIDALGLLTFANASSTAITASNASTTILTVSGTSTQGIVRVIPVTNATQPTMLIGTGTCPIYGCGVAGEMLDAELSWNGTTAINLINGGTGACASTAYWADGNIPALNSNYAVLAFLNTGWTGSGCAFGNAKESALDGVLALPTGNWNLEAGNGAFKFWTATTQSVTIAATGNVGIATTTPGSPLSVQGNMFIAGNIVSTSTLSNIFPYATTTALSVANALYVGNDSKQSFETMAFSFSSSTQGSGTTTKFLGPAAQNLTLDSAQCDSNRWLNIGISNAAGTYTDFLIASNTIGTYNFTNNKTFTAGQAMRVDIGTTTNVGINTNTATSSVGCRIKYHYTI